jgi:hypothetical protein
VNSHLLYAPWQANVFKSYVALNTLNKVVSIDTNAVQRHRNTILDCLRDGDISIRRRALELSYALINESNVRILIRELLAFLEVADNEFKLGMTTQISLAAERFAPNRRWHIDTFLRVLKLVCYDVVQHINLPLTPRRREGWQLRTRGNPVFIHSIGCTYSRAASIHHLQIIHCVASRYFTGIVDPCGGVGDRRIQ